MSVLLFIWPNVSREIVQKLSSSIQSMHLLIHLFAYLLYFLGHSDLLQFRRLRVTRECVIVSLLHINSTVNINLQLTTCSHVTSYRSLIPPTQHVYQCFSKVASPCWLSQEQGTGSSESRIVGNTTVSHSPLCLWQDRSQFWRKKTEVMQRSRWNEV